MIEQLTVARQVGDPPMDELIKLLIKTNVDGRQLLMSLDSQQFEAWPEIIRDFTHQHMTLPKWAVSYRMVSGQRFFVKHAEQVMAMLGLASLPYCYAAKDGAQVLAETGRLVSGASRRLKETSLLLLDMMRRDAFNGPSNSGLKAILKVRMIHGFVRHGLLKKGWAIHRFGIPINQEDMAGTNLAFGLIPVRAMRRAGVSVSQSDFEDYLHLWRVAGYLLGVQTDLNPTDAKSAQILDHHISQRNFAPSEAGRSLTKALIEALVVETPDNFDENLIRNYMAFLLGDKLTNLLDLRPNGANGFIEVVLLRNFITGLTTNGKGTYDKIVRQIRAEGVTMQVNE